MDTDISLSLDSDSLNFPLLNDTSTDEFMNNVIYDTMNTSNKEIKNEHSETDFNFSDVFGNIVDIFPKSENVVINPDDFLNDVTTSIKLEQNRDTPSPTSSSSSFA